MNDAPDGGSAGSVPGGPLVELLVSLGADDDEIANAAEHGHLVLLAVERLALPEPSNRDLPEAAGAAGLRPELVAQLRRSLGFVEADEPDPRYGDTDVEVLRSVASLLDSGVADLDLLVQMARVIGSSTARIASALLDLVDPIGLETPPDDSGADDFAAFVPELLPALRAIIEYVFSRHLQVQARARLERDRAGVGPETLVVGFADLVGFTALSQQLDAHELAEVVDRFETIAYDAVERHGGRVVKMIGDEVMFALADERDAAELALDLAATFRDEHGLSDVRVGLASGPVVQREADLFGPVVNRASRIVSLAYPGTILCDGSVHDALADDDAYTWRDLGHRNLKNIGRVPVRVLRRRHERSG